MGGLGTDPFNPSPALRAGSAQDRMARRRKHGSGRLVSLILSFAGTGNKNDAGKAYDKAAKNYRGEFASLNLNR